MMKITRNICSAQRGDIETRIIELVSQSVCSPHLINFYDLLQEMERIYPDHIDIIKETERCVDELITRFSKSAKKNLNQFIDEVTAKGEQKEEQRCTKIFR